MFFNFYCYTFATIKPPIPSPLIGALVVNEINKVMEQKIIDFLKENTTSDGIDVANGLKIPITEAYSLLGKLEKEGKIKREFYGIQTRYTVLI